MITIASSLNKLLPLLGLLSTVLAAPAALTTKNKPFPFDPGFDIEKVNDLAISLPSHSWEFGTTGEVLLEIYTPELSVFGAKPFPVPTVQREGNRALEYIFKNARLGNGTYDALDRGNGAAGDPASMGVMAVMLGKTNATWAAAADRTVYGLLNDVPRYANGAISHRASVAELWADWVYMAPPTMAYYAADTNDAELLQEVVRQCGLYREILQVPSTEGHNGAWRHIIGPESQEPGLWSTSNGWAAAGMTRVLATILKAPVAQKAKWQKPAVDTLTKYIKEIVDGAMGSDHDHGLLRNYWEDPLGPKGWGEISGSSIIASVVYRMAVIQPKVFGKKYLVWAEKMRATLGGDDKDGNPHVTETGVVTPAVNPLDWFDIRPWTTGSPEGQAFMSLMYAAWRDCIYAGVCEKPRKGASASAEVGALGVEVEATVA